MKSNLFRYAVFGVLTLGLVMPLPAHAYIGPGAGLGAIAITAAVVLGVILLLVGFVWYPLKRLLKSRKSPDGVSDQSRQ